MTPVARNPATRVQSAPAAKACDHQKQPAVLCPDIGFPARFGENAYVGNVWERLAGRESEPFVAGEHRQIAVKVVADRGSEVLGVRKLEEAEEET
jgi:hypothetical protein